MNVTFRNIKTRQQYVKYFWEGSPSLIEEITFFTRYAVSKQEASRLLAHFLNKIFKLPQITYSPNLQRLDFIDILSGVDYSLHFSERLRCAGQKTPYHFVCINK